MNMHLSVLLVTLSVSLLFLSPGASSQSEGSIAEWQDQGDFIQQKLSGMTCDKSKLQFALKNYQILPSLNRGTALNCHYYGLGAAVTVMARYNIPGVPLDNPTAVPRAQSIEDFLEESVTALKYVNATRDLSAPPLMSDGNEVSQHAAAFELLPVELSFDPPPHGALWVDERGYWQVSIRATYPKSSGAAVADLATLLLHETLESTQSGFLLSIESE